MRSALGCSVTFALMALVSAGCRKDTGRTSGQGTPAPGASVPSASEAPPAMGGGPTEPKPRTTPANAVASMAAARCERQVRCNNIGPNETYKTRGECVAKLQNEKAGSINAKECPGGINEANLDRCLKALRDEQCGSPLGTLGRLEACKTDGLCLK